MPWAVPLGLPGPDCPLFGTRSGWQFHSKPDTWKSRILSGIHFIVTSVAGWHSIQQHLINGGFRIKVCKNRFRFRPGLCPGPHWGYYDAPPDLVVRLGREIPPVHSSSASTHSASRCPVRLFNYDHLATLAVPIDSQLIVWLPISVL